VEKPCRMPVNVIKQHCGTYQLKTREHGVLGWGFHKPWRMVSILHETAFYSWPDVGLGLYWVGIKTWSKTTTKRKMIRPGLEPGTFCVLDRCDNQLRHRTARLITPHGHRERERSHPTVNSRYITSEEYEKIIKELVPQSDEKFDTDAGKKSRDSVGGLPRA
jgi:hypothetical protein